ncbi:unnamed protein product [Thelazia callipaeda]|uniref:Sema domain-containing protein n=1 Tax=Thelazia callipaeda TaxID=103827 RepID=A0A0N5D780_THECL|nr:unnamed protein product [Thelazia callipaeda]
MKGFAKEKCQNYITLLLPYESDCLRICGTNAMLPRCWTRKKVNLLKDCEGRADAIGLSSFDKDCPAFYESYANYTFTALSVDISCQKHTLIRALPLESRLWLPVNDDRWFREPEFIALFGWKQYVYVLFNEKKFDQIESRVGVICANDKGFADNIAMYRNTFNFFGKLSLTCSPDDANLYLKKLKTARKFANYMFTIFWNAFEPLPISVLCIFDLNTIEKELFSDSESYVIQHDNQCPKRHSTGYPKIFDKSATFAKPQVCYLFPEISGIVSLDVTDIEHGNYQIIAISKQGKIYTLIFNGTFIIKMRDDQITIDGTISELKIRKKTFTVLSSNSFTNYPLTNLLEINDEKFSSNKTFEWTEWSRCSQRCAEGYQSREWRCFNAESCNFLASIQQHQQYRLCYNEPCGEVRHYSVWSQWLASSENTEIRYRARCGIAIPDAVSIKAVLLDSKRMLIREWLTWSEWTECSATCGNSLRSRWRIRKGFIKSYDDDIQKFVEPCSIPSCKFGK